MSMSEGKKLTMEKILDILAFCREHENIKKINEARITWIGNLEALNRLSETTKGVISSIDGLILNIDSSHFINIIFEDLLEYRDLMKEFLYSLQRTIESIESLVKAYDKILHWASKNPYSIYELANKYPWLEDFIKRLSSISKKSAK